MYPQSFAVRNLHLGVQRLCKLLQSTTITKSLLALSDLWSHPGTAHTMLFMHIDTFWFHTYPWPPLDVSMEVWSPWALKYDACVENHPQRGSYIYSTLRFVRVCSKQPPHCPASERREWEAAQRCVWSDSLNLLQLLSAAMISCAPPERVMNGTAESHNDHILNRRWHWDKARLSLLSVMRVLDYIPGGGPVEETWRFRCRPGWLCMTELFYSLVENLSKWMG